MSFRSPAVDLETVFDCVASYIKGPSVVSLVSKKYYDLDSLSRKDLTVHVPFAPDPTRVSRRFPNLESLTLTSYSHGNLSYITAKECDVPVTPWIREITVKFPCLKSLSIRNVVVSADDLTRLANSLGPSLTSLEIRRCNLFLDKGLMDIARGCVELTSFSFKRNYIHGRHAGMRWLHELALHRVMESLEFIYPWDGYYDEEDVAHLADNCSNSLVSLDLFPQCLLVFGPVFERANKLDHMGTGIVDGIIDYSHFEFPPNIRGLRLQFRIEPSFPFLLPYLNQLRELDLSYVDTQPVCECSLYERCPNLEVLHTHDICEDIGFQLIGQFCKKLRKLTHYGWATHLGLKAVAQGCPDLEYLKVFMVDISNEALECVGNHLKNLHDFRIWMDSEEDCESPLDNGVRAMLIGCSKLERLDLWLHFNGLTDVGLGYIGKHGHKLSHLSLRCTGESDRGLLELSEGCPNLRKLKVSHCPFSEQVIASHVFKINQSLRYVRDESDPRGNLVLTRPMVFAEVPQTSGHGDW